MSNIGTFVTIQDIIADSNQLFNGEKIVIHCDRMNMKGNPNIQGKEKGFQVVEFTTADNSDVGSNYNRRKTNVSYMGFANPTISISGMMSENDIGSDTINISGSDYKVLTPTRFMQLVHSGRQFRLWDYSLISYLSATDSDGNQYYSDDGMPVGCSIWNMEPFIGEETKGINWSLDLIEDKI